MKRMAWLLSLALVLSWTFVAAAEYDFGGRTVTYYSPHDMQRHFEVHFQDFGRFREMEFAVQQIEEEFNVNLVFEHMPGDQNAVQAMATAVLSGDVDAIFNIINWAGEIAALENLLYPLDEVLGHEYYDSLHPLLTKPMRDQGQSMVRGTTYFFLDLPDASFGQGVPGVVWNIELFEREGLPDLFELYESGEWTWEAFRDIALRATKDTTGDGEIDQWGTATLGGMPNGAHWWVYLWHWALTNDAPMTRTDGEQEVFAFNDEKAYEAFYFWQDLMESGVVGPDVWGAFHSGHVAMGMSMAWISYYYGTMDEAWGFVPLPKGPHADEHVAYTDQFWTMALPANARDPRALVELSSAVGKATSTYRDMDAWAEGLRDQWLLDFFNLETWDTLEWMLQEAQPLRYRGVLSAIPELVEAVGSALSGQEHPATAMGRVADVVQARLDEVFGQ